VDNPKEDKLNPLVWEILDEMGNERKNDNCRVNERVGKCVVMRTEETLQGNSTKRQERYVIFARVQKEPHLVYCAYVS